MEHGFHYQEITWLFIYLSNKINYSWCKITCIMWRSSILYINLILWQVQTLRWNKQTEITSPLYYVIRFDVQKVPYFYDMCIRTVSKADEGGIITLSKASCNRNRRLTVRYGYEADLQTSGEQWREFTYTVFLVILAVKIQIHVLSSFGWRSTRLNFSYNNTMAYMSRCNEKYVLFYYIWMQFYKKYVLFKLIIGHFGKHKKASYLPQRWCISDLQLITLKYIFVIYVFKKVLVEVDNWFIWTIYPGLAFKFYINKELSHWTIKISAI